MSGLDSSLSVRVSSKDITKFKKKCRTMHRPFTNVLREIIVAFNEGRLHITPKTDQANELEIYK